MNRAFRRLLYPLLFLLWLAPPVPSQGLPTATPEEVGLSSERLSRIGTVMQEAVKQNQIAGVVTAVARRGKVAYLESFGMMDIEAKKPMRTDTIVRIASMTKPITCVAVMMLYEEGRFLLEDPVSKYIPEFKNPQVLVLPSSEASTSAPYTTVPAKQEITIRHLLTHTSGITYRLLGRKPLAEIYKKAGISDGLTQTEGTIGDKVKILAGLPLLFHPGESVEGSLSIDVLGYLVEVISGMPLDQFFQERLFKPLGMKDTHFYIPEEKLPRLAGCYGLNPAGGINRLPEEPVDKGDVVYSASYPYRGPRTYFSGGVGLVSTISDYMRFLQMMLNGGELDGVRLLSRKTVELMTINQIGDLGSRKGYKFGLGFSIHTDPGQSGQIGSVGEYSGSGFFWTNFFVDPKEELIGIFMSQMQPGDRTLNGKFKVLAYQAIVD